MKRYKTTVNGVETTLLLNDADAEAQGLKPAAESKAKTPANKARRPANKSAKGDA